LEQGYGAFGGIEERCEQLVDEAWSPFPASIGTKPAITASEVSHADARGDRRPATAASRATNAAESVAGSGERRPTWMDDE